MNILLFYILCSYFLLTDQWRIILFSQNGCFKKKKNKAHQIFRKTNISNPLIRTYVCVSGGKKCSFFEKFGVLCFFETPVLRFALLPYYRRYVFQIFCKIFSVLYIGGFCGVQFLSLCLKIFRLASFFRSLGSFLPLYFLE